MDTEIIKPITKIPFSQKEVFNSLEEMLKRKIYKTIQILYLNKYGFEFKNSELACYYDNDDFFLFPIAEPITNSVDFDPRIYFTHIIPKVENITYPTEKDFEKILPLFKKKKNIRYVGDINGGINSRQKIVYELIKDKWDRKDWTGNIEAHPVVIYRPDGIHSIPKILLYLLRNELIPYINLEDEDIHDYNILMKFSKYINIQDDKYVFDFENIDQDLFYNCKDDIYKDLLGRLGLSVPLKYEGVVDYLKNCEKQRCGLEEFADSVLKGTDENAGLWNFWTNEKDDTYSYPMPEGDTLYARNPCYDIQKNGIIGIDFGTSSTVVVRTTYNSQPVLMSIGGGEKYENPTIMQVKSLEKFMQAYTAKDSRPDTKWEDLWVSHIVNDNFNKGAITVENVSSMLSKLKQWAADDSVNTVIKPVYDGKPTTIKSISKLLGSNEFNPIEIYAYYIGLYINNSFVNHGIYLNYYMSFPAKYDIHTRENIRKSFELGIRKSIPKEVFEDPSNQLVVKMDVTEPEAYAATALRTIGFNPKPDEKLSYAIYDFGGGTSDFAYGYWKKRIDGKTSNYIIENLAVDGDRYLGGENILEGLAFEVFSNNLDIMAKNDCCFYYGLPDQDTSRVPEKYLSVQQTAKKNMKALIEVLREYWENQNIKFLDKLEYSADDFKRTDIEALLLQIMASENINSKPDLKERYNNVLNDLRANKDTPEHSYLRIYKLNEELADELVGDKDPDKLEFNVTLTSEHKKGENEFNEQSVTLSYSLNKMYNYFEKKIKRGVDSFFSKLIDVFFTNQQLEEKETVTINILFAGNSSKSPILRKVMNNKITDVKDYILKKFNISSNFRLFSPLGTDAIYEEMAQLLQEQGVSEEKIKRGIDRLKNSNQKPTGKTGVAFGLIKLGMQQVILEREKVKDEEFMFYLGYQDVDEDGLSDVFKPIDFISTSDGKIRRGKPKLAEFYKAFDIVEGRDIYYLWYTSNPKCLSEDYLEIEDTYNIEMPIENNDIDKHIFVRAKSSNTIEWVVAKDSKEATKIMEGELTPAFKEKHICILKTGGRL